MRALAAVGALVVAWAACSSKDSAAVDPTPHPEAVPEAPVLDTTVNQFFAAGTPTFVIGTAGDDRADAVVAGQAELIRSLLFPDAKVVVDTDVTDDTWPSNPVVYGGAHVNALIARLALPLTIRAGRLEIGGERFGPDHAIAAYIPAETEHPGFLLLAGTDDPGVAGINANIPGDAPIVVLDAFGPLVTGHWTRAGDRIEAHLDGERGRRLVWRRDDRKLPGGATASIRFLKDYPVANEKQLANAVMAGLGTAIARLGLERPGPVTVYVHPDRGSKKSLTGNDGDGHAVVAMRTLHVVAGPGLEQLLAHEGTHVLVGDRLGPEGTAALGEGLAVWASGRYQGKTLEDWHRELSGRVNVRVVQLLGPTFRKLPESGSYPVAGLLVGALIDAVGMDAFGAHLYGATADTWADACKAAGTTPEAVDAAFASLFVE